MKIIKIANQIISLENVREVELIEFGTGSKANPYTSTIEVSYMNTNETSRAHFDDNGVHNKGTAVMEQIYKILSEG